MQYAPVCTIFATWTQNMQTKNNMHIYANVHVLSPTKSLKSEGAALDLNHF